MIPQRSCDTLTLPVVLFMYLAGNMGRDYGTLCDYPQYLEV